MNIHLRKFSESNLRNRAIRHKTMQNIPNSWCHYNFFILLQRQKDK